MLCHYANEKVVSDYRHELIRYCRLRMRRRHSTSIIPEALVLPLGHRPSCLATMTFMISLVPA